MAWQPGLRIPALHTASALCPAGDTTTKFVEGIDYAPHAGQLLHAACFGGQSVRAWCSALCWLMIRMAQCAAAMPVNCNLALDPIAVEIVQAGLQTTVQDYPGRVALWSVGVPPSGPMDDLSHR